MSPRAIDPFTSSPLNSDEVTKVVSLVSPLRGDTTGNTAYAQRAIRDCLERGEAPFAPHLLYPDLLADEDGDVRQRAVNAAQLIANTASATVVYADLGITSGMKSAIDHAESEKRPVITRYLDPRPELKGMADSHEHPNLIKVLLFSKNNCIKCSQTVKSLNKRGIIYEYINVEEEEGQIPREDLDGKTAYEYVTQVLTEKFPDRQMPVVQVFDDIIKIPLWSGLRPDAMRHLERYIKGEIPR